MYAARLIIRSAGLWAKEKGKSSVVKELLSLLYRYFYIKEEHRKNIEKQYFLVLIHYQDEQIASNLQHGGSMWFLGMFCPCPPWHIGQPVRVIRLWGENHVHRSELLLDYCWVTVSCCFAPFEVDQNLSKSQFWRSLMHQPHRNCRLVEENAYRPISSCSPCPKTRLTWSEHPATEPP